MFVLQHRKCSFANKHDIVCQFLALLPARYILALLGSIGMGIAYGLKVNLSVAVVAMVNHTAVVSHSNLYDAVQTSDGEAPACQASNSIEKPQVSSRCFFCKFKSNQK